MVMKLYLLFLILLMVPVAETVCCGDTSCGPLAVKCCAKKCNIFCCNCDTDCNYDCLGGQGYKATTMKNRNANNETFYKLDTDKDGRLSHLELATVIENTIGEDNVAKDWFKKMDTNRDGHVSPHEFDKDLV